jgi:hypothetical protein
MHEVRYSKSSATELRYLGRNRYGKQCGVALVDRWRDGRKVMRLYPITTRGTVSEACHLEVPPEAVPALLKAIRRWHRNPRDHAFLEDGPHVPKPRT